MQKLSEINEEKKFGGKAVNLSKLKAAGFSVKEAIVIDIEEVKNIILTQRVPKQIISEIVNLLNFGSHGVAVRSSAVGEDSVLSWAGQFKTCLFVQSDELEKAILECANAQKSEAVKAYAGVHTVEVPPLALIVQEMVNAEIAGVLFTINPITGSNEVIVEAVSGTGVSLVNGTRQPVRYHLDFETKQLILREGNEGEVNLSLDQLNQLVSIGKQIYELFRRHQDIEWAIEHGTGKIFVNQSRDITAVGEQNIKCVRERIIYETESALHQETQRLQQLGVVLKRKDVLSDQNIAELLTPHPCQMAFGLFTYKFAHGDGAIRTTRNEIGYEIGPELDTGFFYLVGGQPRCSIVHDAFTYRIKGVPMQEYCNIIDYYLERIGEDASLANYPEVVLYEQKPSFAFLTELFGRERARKYCDAYHEFFDGIRSLEDELDRICREEFLPQWNAKMICYREIEIVPDVSILSARFQEICDLLRTDACSMFVKAARLGFFAYARLRQLLTEMFGAEAESYLNLLSTGILPEVDPNLRFNIQLAGLKKGTVSLGEIVAEFGHLAPHELEISVPRYREQPELLQELAEKITQDPFQDFKESAEKSLQLKNRVLAVAGKRSEELVREINAARTYLPLRETVKFAFLRAYELLREIAVQIEKLLNWEEGLIFHLDPREVFIIAEQTNELHELARERHWMWNMNKTLYVPPILNVEHLEHIGRFSENDSKILRGTGVTNSVTEGEVVVVRSLDEGETLAQLHSGSILVTITTDPAWTPLFSVIGHEGGLVTEIGGLLAHGAIYAREVGMAAVLNVPNATHILKTGMRVRVSGPQGYVEILDKP